MGAAFPNRHREVATGPDAGPCRMHVNTHTHTHTHFSAGALGGLRLPTGRIRSRSTSDNCVQFRNDASVMKYLQQQSMKLDTLPHVCTLRAAFSHVRNVSHLCESERCDGFPDR